MQYILRTSIKFKDLFENDCVEQLTELHYLARYFYSLHSCRKIQILKFFGLYQPVHFLYIPNIFLKKLLENDFENTF
jgi:hypothetical protein